ncbi:MAG: geranyl transferase [Gammaproteobacteria bacterium]|nr:geranyl transferase [Gammaproteobacteria bacterium]
MLKQALSNSDCPDRLAEAMRYSALAGGKRLRALLVYAAGRALDAPLERLDVVATAVECLHCYSLIHDDLPAMDDDELRRGKATSHIKFDEATAILAGDALQALAFELLSAENSHLNDFQSRAITHKLAFSAGRSGMVGGQILDVFGTEQNLSRAALENMHRRKTGALINAAVICGALCGDDVPAGKMSAMHAYADNIGLAFQVVDDVLDIESSTEVLGKSNGSDLALGKSTYPALIGLKESKELAQNLYQQAIASLASIGDNSAHLADLAALVVNRNH